MARASFASATGEKRRVRNPPGVELQACASTTSRSIARDRTTAGVVEPGPGARPTLRLTRAAGPAAPERQQSPTNASPRRFPKLISGSAR